MEVIITRDYDELSRLAASWIGRQIREKPNCVLGLATGTTPIGLYRELVRMHREEGLDFAQVTTFNLDEYLGLPPDHPQSYRNFMEEHLFRHVNISKEQTYVPLGRPENLVEFCAWYERQIAEHDGIDVQVLGIGGDGHIGFNEPGSSLGSRTRVKTLTAETIQANARFFASPSEVPRFAITMGVGTILDARQILLLASGSAKADIVAAGIEGPVTAQVTASALQLHRNVTALLDEPAAARLRRREYYQWVYEQKTRLLPEILGRLN